MTLDLSQAKRSWLGMFVYDACESLRKNCKLPRWQTTDAGNQGPRFLALVWNGLWTPWACCFYSLLCTETAEISWSDFLCYSNYLLHVLQYMYFYLQRYMCCTNWAMKERKQRWYFFMGGLRYIYERKYFQSLKIPLVCWLTRKKL